MKSLEYFRCKLTNSWICFELDDNTADMKTFDFEYYNIKPFFSLMSESIEKLKLKKVNKIRQMVTIDDYDSFLKSKTKWDVIEKDDILQSYLIECDIEDFINNFAKGHGV